MPVTLYVIAADALVGGRGGSRREALPTRAPVELEISAAASRPTPSTMAASRPVVIVAGGTYSGMWESDSADVPAVTIQTAEPVVIVDSVIRGRGNLIQSKHEHAKITVRRTQGEALNPNQTGRGPGRFLSAEFFDMVSVEDCTLKGTSGIYLYEWKGTQTPAIQILCNEARNIDGRKSDGRGGWLDFNARRRKSDGAAEEGYHRVQFVQLNAVRQAPGVEIAWNRVTNEPGQSRVEDCISIHNSGGTKDSPIRIHDNLIDGAYNLAPWEKSRVDATYEYDWGYSGGGIMVGDGNPENADHVPAYVLATGNVVLNTGNYGIAISSGHDMEVVGNKVLASGKLADGRAVVAQNVGIYIWDMHKQGPKRFFGNVGRKNVVGWVKGDGRNDWWTPDAAGWEGNEPAPRDLVEATRRERAAWERRRAMLDAGS